MRVNTGLLIISIGIMCLLPSVNADIIQVKADGTGDYPTIQAAIDVAVDGDIVQVEDGIYRGHRNRDIQFEKAGVTVRGNPNFPENVVIDCQGNQYVQHRGFNISGFDNNMIIEGFTIINGYKDLGGAIYSHGDAIIRHCNIIGNHATSQGGGIGSYYKDTIIENCKIMDNTCDDDGGGIYFKFGTPTIRNCVISNNSCAGHGGGIGCYAELTVKNCTITNNIGGGIFNNEHHDLRVSVYNSILWGNSTTQIFGYTSDIRYNNIQGVFFSGINNINQDPLFDSDGYHLLPDSPCINTANPAYIPDSNEVDIDSKPRVIAGRLDIGASEFCTDTATFVMSDYNPFVFIAQQARSNPVPQSFTLYNLGTQPLNWASTSNVSWLSTDPATGSFSYEDSEEINILIDIDDLPPGQYLGQITLSDPQADNNPKIIDVELTVFGPAIEISQDSFILTASKKTLKPESQLLTILNAAGGILNWQIDVPAECQWLIVEPISGQSVTEPNEVTLSIDPAYAEYGTDMCQLTVSDPNASNSPQVVTVTLEVLRPEMGLGQTSFSLTAENMTNPPEPQVMTISNTGYDTLRWVISEPNLCDWLIVTPDSGQTDSGTSTDVELSFDPAVAGYGLHSCELTISDPNASNSPQVVTVTLEVLRPEIELSMTSYSFECDVDDPNVLTQTLSISNSGYGDLNWQAVEDCDWLSVEPGLGQCVSGPNEVILIVDTDGLDVGIHHCDLMIQGENASNSPLTISVSLHVYRDGQRHVPMEYPTIRDAINAAVDGDHIIIHPGIYMGQDNQSNSFGNKELVIRSIDPDDPQIVESTVISGEDLYGEICFDIFDNNKPGNRIAGLTMRDFRDPSIRCYNGYVHVDNCVFVGNDIGGQQTQWYPGIITCNVGAIDIEGCRFYENHPHYSPYQIAAIAVNYSSAVIRNCLVSTFITEGNDSQAGVSGMIFYNSDAEISNCTIGYNGKIYQPWRHTIAGGLFIRESDVSIDNSIVWGNVADYGENIAIINSLPMDGMGGGVSRVAISCCNIQGGREQIGLFPVGDGQPYTSTYHLYINEGVLPDPNLMDPNTLNWGDGNISIDPLFVREPNDGGDAWVWGESESVSSNNDYGDLHLKSQAGRFVWDGFAEADFNLDARVDLSDFTRIAQNWQLSGYPWNWYPWQSYDLDKDSMIGLGDIALFSDDYLQPRTFGAWVVDDVTSPCIDAGDPNDASWQNELWPHGGRVNMGAYGGTPAASMSPNPTGNPADLNHDDAVDLTDWSLWSDDWLTERVLIDSDLDRDNDVDPNDLGFFLQQWLWTE